MTQSEADKSMTTDELIEALSQPRAWPFPVDRVEVVQTHISAVFLAGEFAFKVKKPVNLGFVDFTGLEQRLLHCQNELKLNRRLAPGVYHDVLPITRNGDRVLVGGGGELVDYAVRMRRLPAQNTFRAIMARGEPLAPLLKKLAAKLAGFYREAASGPEISCHADRECMTDILRENLSLSRQFLGRTVDEADFAKLESAVGRELERMGDLIEKRALAFIPRDCHGDLRLEHIYSFPGEQPPGDLVVVDCLEFSPRLRCNDPVTDYAFLAMELDFEGRPDLAEVFLDECFRLTNDEEGRALLPLFTAYRHIVRGKVRSFMTGDLKIPETQRQEAVERARRHYLRALEILEG